ncbi:MAG: coproporphyrinogen dehydrogenase [Sphingomonadales bacterium]|nr:coproporphyrinogen dehydrogenase [Sphingomonadales bacterium]
MWSYHPDLLARPAPRYTSYPTAAEFGPLDPAAQAAAIAGLSGPVSLYVHIPFCEAICWYCGCNTSAVGRRERLDRYVEALAGEIAHVGRLLPRGTEVTQVAFGGGSPNALSPARFVELVRDITLAFRLLGNGWSIELDPRLMSEDWELVLRAIGVTRASLGVQTFSPRLQQAIGRVQPDAMIASGVARLRRAGVTSLNFDLMYGLPGQTGEDLEASLARSIALGADRIALFGYAHVPHQIARQRRIDASALPGQEDRFAMAALGHARLVDAGYVAVGFDHFARPGDPLARAAATRRLHRNFQGFSEDRATSVLGLGASAISSFEGLLAQNEKNTGLYRARLQSHGLATALGCARSAEDRRRGAAIEALLCHGSTSLRRLPDAPGLRQRLQPFLDRGLARLAAGRLSILEAGVPYARSIAALLDSYRDSTSARFSPAI